MLTGYYRKSAVRVSSYKLVKKLTVYGHGRAVKLKPEKKRPTNRKGSGSIPTESSRFKR
jgi:hypothetical protein